MKENKLLEFPKNQNQKTIKKQTGFAWTFLEAPVQSIQSAPILYFNPSFSDVPSFFKNISTPRLEPTNGK